MQFIPALHNPLPNLSEVRWTDVKQWISSKNMTFTEL